LYPIKKEFQVLKLKKASETLLHNKLKQIYKEREEVESEYVLKLENQRYRLDLFDKKKNFVYEIQRTGFGGTFSKKIQNLLDNDFQVRIIHPIVQRQKISRFQEEILISTSYRNRKTTILNFFENLVHFKVSYQDNLEFDVLLIHEHVLRDFFGHTKRSGRRKFQTKDRDLIKIEKRVKIRSKSDFMSILPRNLPIPFTNKDIYEHFQFSATTRRNSRIPGLLTYSLCQLGLLKRVGKERNAYLFDYVDKKDSSRDEKIS
jgi:hypothetical protein